MQSANQLSSTGEVESFFGHSFWSVQLLVVFKLRLLGSLVSAFCLDSGPRKGRGSLAWIQVGAVFRSQQCGGAVCAFCLRLVRSSTVENPAINGNQETTISSTFPLTVGNHSFLSTFPLPVEDDNCEQVLSRIKEISLQVCCL